MWGKIRQITSKELVSKINRQNYALWCHICMYMMTFKINLKKKYYLMFFDKTKMSLTAYLYLGLIYFQANQTFILKWLMISPLILSILLFCHVLPRIDLIDGYNLQLQALIAAGCQARINTCRLISVLVLCLH